MSDVGYIESVQLFSETMTERFINGNDRSILVFATDGAKAYCATHGDQRRVEQAIFDACIRDEGLIDVIGSAIAHCISDEMRDHIDGLAERLIDTLNNMFSNEEDDNDDTD